jgi:predicted ATPase/DNA-binding CsgD family transcriptional regulator
MRPQVHMPSYRSLPVYFTRFVGRDHERQDLRRLLEGGRLLTLSGPAGSGKTRLAVQVAIDNSSHYPDGAWFVDLARVEEESALVQAVAVAVGSQERPGRGAVESLAASLHKARALLILDSCEHLIESSATLVEALMVSSPGLHVLTTSMEPLGIPGEAIYPVPPLSLPRSDSSISALLESEAGQLFIDRARLTNARLDLSERNAAAMAQVCRELDGLPLALELAAARTRFMPVGELLRKLEDRFKLLKGASRRVLPRHQTLAATMKWSHDHLTDAEQVLFRRVSVFVGGFTQEAAEEVCTGTPIGRSDVSELLERLVDKSFSYLEEGRDGNGYYRLLPLLRRYAEERMVEANEADIRRLHAQYFAGVAESADRVFLEGGDQVAALSRLEQHQDDIKSALGWALEAEPALAVRLAGAMGYFWRWQGYLSEGRRLLENARAHAEDGTLEELVVLFALSGIAVRQGDLVASWEYAEKARRVATEVGDVKARARAFLTLGIAAHGKGDLAQARMAYEQVLSLEAGTVRETAGALNNLAVIEYDEGHYDRARLLSEQALETLKTGQYQLVLCQLLDTALRIDLALEDLWTARQRLEELLNQPWERQLILVSSILDSIAMLLVNDSRPKTALRVAGAAAAVRERIGNDSPPPWARERDSTLSRARRAVGEQLARRLFTAGRDIGVESAVQLAGLPGHQSDSKREGVDGLTPRQRQIVAFVAHGLTNQEISRKLRISVRTVDAHLDHIRARLEVKSRAQIAAWMSNQDGGAREST